VRSAKGGEGRSGARDSPTSAVIKGYEEETWHEEMRNAFVSSYIDYLRQTQQPEKADRSELTSLDELRFSTIKLLSRRPNKTYVTLLYAIHYMLYTICYTLYAIHYMLYTIHYMLYTICYTLYTICYTLYAIHYTVTTLYSNLVMLVFSPEFQSFTANTPQVAPAPSSWSDVAPRRVCR